MTDRDQNSKAVALQYDGGGAPRVTAKGDGAVADQIIATAEEHGVPIEENAALAEALGTIELEDEIPIELYQAVAEVISYVMRSADKAR